MCHLGKDFSVQEAGKTRPQVYWFVPSYGDSGQDSLPFGPFRVTESES